MVLVILPPHAANIKFIIIIFILDVHAVRWSFGICLEIGDFERMRDIMTRTVHYYPKNTATYPYILSM